MTDANGLIESPVSKELQTRPATLDRSTQTEPSLQDRVPLPKRIQSLHLEDALLLGNSMLEGTRAKLHRTPGMEEEDEEQEEDEGVGEQETLSVEEPIQPTMIRSHQREDSQDGSCSPEETGSFRNSDQNLSSRSGPLSSIQEGEKSLCVLFPQCCFFLNHYLFHKYLKSSC